MADDDALLELARLIRAEVERIASDPTSHPDLLQEVFERADREERARLAQQVFDTLEPDQQWSILERVFGDDDLREFLDSRRGAHHELCARARAAGALDTRDIPAGERLVLGLFREADVRPALTRGHRSAAAARRLTLRALGDGVFQVLNDEFNPDSGYFVTREYDENTWRSEERIEGHAHVRVGSIRNHTLEPVIHPGGRVDLGTEEGDVRGQLYLGFAVLGDAGLFSP